MKQKIKNNFKKYSAIITALVVVIIIICIALLYPTIHKKILAYRANNAKGCYVRIAGPTVYSLDVTSQDGQAVTGTLVFNNPGQTSSVGTIKGTYKNGILLANYDFQGNGLHSAMEVIFKKQGSDFIGGYEKNGIIGGFRSLDDITYDESGLYKASSQPCATTL